MRKKLFILIMMILTAEAVSFAVEGGVSQQRAQPFAGQDLHLSGREVISYQSDSGEHILVFQDGFSMSIGANQFFSDSAVVWLKGVTTEFLGRSSIEYKVRAYLEGGVSIKKGKGTKTTDLSQTVVEDRQSMAVQFGVSGEVFVTADRREIADPRGLELYKKAEAAVVPAGPEFVVQPEAMVPELPREEVQQKRPPKEAAAVPPKPKKEAAAVPHKPKKELAAAPPKPAKERLPAPAKPQQGGLLEMIFGGGEAKAAKPAKAVAEPEAKKPRFTYPVNIAPAGKVEPKIERTKAPDGTDVATVIGRFYVWQKQDEEGGLLELEGDNAVMFYSGPERSGEEQGGAGEVLAEGGVQAIYMSGDVVMTEGQRTIRADEMYYDFQNKKALAVNAVVRNFDVERGIPIYVRAVKLRRIAEDKFAAENAMLTSSEFYLPQISLTASSVLITDTTAIDAQKGQVSNSSYDVQMRDVRLKKGKRTLFYWPFMRANLERPDVPIKSVHTGHDSTFGTFVESRWYLSRLLGLREPEGTDSTLLLDYYSKRGLGTGVEINYNRENYYGELLGYVVNDSGKDRLGRMRSRKDLEPDNELRGRFTWRHRQFLPYNWQLTTGISYISDENFIESFYRREFYTGEKQETYVHLKRLQDNWALSFLGKMRINKFADELEELPSVEFHLTGQSLFEDRFTLYSDTELSRLRQKIGKDHSEPIHLGLPLVATNLTEISEEQFSFVSHRTELDMPILAEPFKIVPYVAGTFGHDDRSGYTRTLVDGSNTGSFGEKNIWIGEAGIRVFPRPYWKVYPNVKSRLWDLSQLRHIIRPYLTAVVYEESDDVVEQRDALNVGISQRLQTKRGPEGKQRTVEWMRLDTEVTWLNHTGEAADSGPDRFIWARPLVPLRVLSAPEIFNGDLITHDGVRATGLHRFEMFGPRRDYFSADYIWRISDTTALLSDINFDIQSRVVQQFNIGFSHLCWPNLSYYIGSRYLRRVRVLDEEGSNAFTFAVTYVLDPRYTIIFAQECDLDYGVNVRSDITLLRRYHRMYYGLTFSADESLDRQAIVFSIWPQGIPEMGIGGRRYTGMTGPAGY
jgi:hypothetical protein